MGINNRSETDEGFGGGIDPNRGYGPNSVGTSSSYIEVSGNTGGSWAGSDYTGSGNAIDKMPPYIVKYCWERTA